MDMKEKYKRMFDNPAPTPGIPKEEPRRRMSEGLPGTHEELEQRLITYRELALDLGADDAKIVKVKDIPQDPRVILICGFPKCPGYGRSGSCPPHVKGNYNEAAQNLAAYKEAIVYRVNLAPEGLKYLTGPELLKTTESREAHHAGGSMLRYINGIGDQIASEAFYDGYYFALNCHFGPCLVELCESFKNCQEIETGICRFPFKAAPSPEQYFAVDDIKLANNLGWDYRMLGPRCGPPDFPPGYNPFFIGLVLIN
jgi:predicted metal-binding protein